MKTRKCIMKAGSFDNYLLTTKPNKIGSKFGLYLREVIKKKQKNPEYEHGYIPGTSSGARSRKTKIWEYKQLPTMYVPSHVKATVDQSLFYEKAPSDMSRYELQELERYMKQAEESLGQEEKQEVLFDEDGNPLSKQEMLLQDKEYLATREEIRKLQPMRIGVFKRYWDKFRFNKTRRQYLIEMFDETDKQIEFYLGDEYKNWRDEIPGTRQFLKELESKKRETDILTQNKGNTIIRTIKGTHAELNYQEIEYSPKTFNPFDRLNIKT